MTHAYDTLILALMAAIVVADLVALAMLVHMVIQQWGRK